MTLLFIAFVAGLLTVLAPCTLPLLPVIIGGSVSGKPNIWRALVIAVSLGASIFLFTLVLKASTVFINVPASFWNLVSGGLLIIFGLVTVFPALWDRLPFVNVLSRSSNKLLGEGYTKGNITGDIIIGAALGPVFSSCSPTYFIVLATVLPVHPAEGVIYLLAYCIGLILSLLVVAVIGQKIVDKLGIASDPKGWFKRIIGILFIAIGIVIVTGYSTMIESEILSHAGVFDVTQIEQRLLTDRGADKGLVPTPATTTPSAATSASSTSPSTTSSSNSFLSAFQKSLKYPKAPELTGIDGYLNTGGQPINLAQYKGKDVVLIDFWTYSCINCLRTIPYLNAWYDKYKDQGLVIIGVHTPEFAFEHVEANVADALTRLGIKYPVVLDNEYATWNAFSNEYWPREYLVDIDGYIVHDHAGEGEYDVTEKAIQDALAERAARLGTSTAIASSTVNIATPDLSVVQSPETYFGSARNEYLGNGNPGVAGNQTFTLPSSPDGNTLYLGGSWNITDQYAESNGPATIQYSYSAHDIDFVASAATPVTLDILLDGKPVGSLAGTDVDPKTSQATIQADRLYNLVHDATPGAHTIEIKTEGAGLEAYTFTFG